MFSRRNPIAVAVLPCLLALALPEGAAGQVEPYTHAVRAGAYQPLSPADGAVVNLNATADAGGSAAVDLPFPVRFYGKRYEQISVGTSGYLTFGPPETSSCTNSHVNCAEQPNNQTIPSAAFPNQLLAVWWGDFTCPAGTLRSQVRGEAPHRTFVVEWNECDRASHTHVPFQEYWSAQAWFFEGSSTLEVHYGGAKAENHAASVGIEDPTGTLGNAPLGCQRNCKDSHWPGGKVIVYSQGPHLVVSGIQAAGRAFAGLPFPIEAKVRNEGGVAAPAFSVSFALSRSPTGTNPIPLGNSEPKALAPGELATWTLDPVLPADLEEDTWYLIAEADPFNAVPQVDKSDSKGVMGPLLIDGSLPDLTLEALRLPRSARPGGKVLVEWTTRNLGNANSGQVKVLGVLSKNEEPHVGERVWFTETVAVPAFGAVDRSLEFTVPADLPTGIYRVGLFADPDGALEELDKTNNSLRSEELRISATQVEIVTKALADAVVGAPWAMRLDAVGGDGNYVWSVAKNSALPPGLGLVREGEATLLAGTPTEPGSFDFSVTVASGGLAATRAFELLVSRDTLPLTVTTAELPAVPLRFAYEAELGAVGGTPPYNWSLIEGRLPRGLSLHKSGRILGTPEEDGSRSFQVQVEDAGGLRATAALQIHVLPPAELQCLSRTLPTVAVGEKLVTGLAAAGGNKPYEWVTTRAFRLADGVFDRGESFDGLPPPGLSLSESGFIAGAPTQAGRFLWIVEVSEKLGGGRDTCALVFEVVQRNEISVITTSLADAVANTPYAVTLRASGGSGLLHWEQLGGTLPAGLSLASSGELEGTPSLIGGKEREEHVLLVQVRDSANRRGVAALRLAVVEGQADAPAKPKDEGGCQTGAGGNGWALPLSALLFLAARRQRRA